MAEYVSRHSIKGEEVAELCRTHFERYTGSLGRITDARQLLIGEMRAPLPDVIAGRPDGEAFRVDTAQKYTATLQLVNKLSEPEPQMKRPKTATSDLAERNSSRIEKFVNPALRRLMSHRDAIELLLVEAEGAALVRPNVANWRRVPGDYYEDDGETVKRAFRRDETGKSYDDAVDEDEDGDEERVSATFKTDEKRSRAAYDRHVRHQRARHFPAEVELLSRQQMVPINPRVRGYDVDIDGLLIKTKFNRSELIRRNYIWTGMNDHLEPTSSAEGDGNEFWLYEAWLTDQDDEGNLYPYVAYSVAGKPTSNSRDGFEADAVIDLYKTCALRSLPVAYGYGWRWFTVDPDKRAIPYTFPFGRSWLATDAFLTGKAYAGWSEGMLAWFMQMPDSVKDPAMQQAWMEFVQQNPLTIEPFKILPVWGSMIPAQHPGTGRDVGEMVSALQGSNSGELVNPLARGGGDAASAIEREVVSADTVAGIMDVRRSAMHMRKRVGEILLEICTGISRKHKKDVLIYGNPDQPTDREGNSSITRAIIELKPHWLGPEGEESFDLVPILPKSLGDNLAEKAQLFGFWQAGAITDEQWCEAIGVSDPDRYIAQLIFDRWKKDPQGGVPVMMMDAAKYLGDQELVEMFEAQQKGAAGPQGQPMGMVAGINPPMGFQDPAAQAMTAVQDPAMNQMAAIAGAARSADAASVGPTPSQAGIV